MTGADSISSGESMQRTTLVIAHRLSTVQMADQIICMENGRVMEIGTHNELIEKSGGRYRALLRRQSIPSTVML